VIASGGRLGFAPPGEISNDLQVSARETGQTPLLPIVSALLFHCYFVPHIALHLASAVYFFCGNSKTSELVSAAGRRRTAAAAIVFSLIFTMACCSAAFICICFGRGLARCVRRRLPGGISNDLQARAATRRLGRAPPDRPWSGAEPSCRRQNPVNRLLFAGAEFAPIMRDIPFFVALGQDPSGVIVSQPHGMTLNLCHIKINTQVRDPNSGPCCPTRASGRCAPPLS